MNLGTWYRCLMNMKMFVCYTTVFSQTHITLRDMEMSRSRRDGTMT